MAIIKYRDENGDVQELTALVGPGIASGGTAGQVLKKLSSTDFETVWEDYAGTESDPTVSSWAKAASKPTYTASEVGAIPSSEKGAISGVAELDSSGKILSSELPSYVDDIVEYSALASFPETGETGKIYVDTTTNKTYRWSGTAYVEISPSLALGETSSTAYRGDYGAAAYAHGVTNKGSAFTSGLYKITSNSEGHITAATAVVKADITALGIPSSDTTYSDATTSVAGLMSATDKTKLDGIATGANLYTHPSSGVTAGTYKSVTVNAAGHVTAGTNPTTLTEYGITGGTFSGAVDMSGRLTMGSAGTIVLGAALYGADLPSSGVAGQLFFKQA